MELAQREMGVPTREGHSSNGDGAALLLREPCCGSFHQPELCLKQETGCNAEHLLQMNTALSCSLLPCLFASGTHHSYTKPSSQVKLNVETKERGTTQISLDAANAGLQQEDCKKEQSGLTASSQVHPPAHA